MNYKTDKFANGLIKYYEDFFRKSADVKKVLEVGTFKGGFLDWLTDIFPSLTVFGADIDINEDINELVARKPQIKIYKADQKNNNDLALIAPGETFDVIIDDGSHIANLTKNTFDNLFPRLRSGGFYIIEDFVAGYWPQYPQYANLHDLVFDIAKRKDELGIANFNIILREPKCSLAFFQKK